MFKNYIKIAFRNLVKNKTFSIVNLLGLTLGFGCFILLSLFVIDEMSFDNFHEEADEIYRVIQHITEPSGDSRNLASIAPLIGPEAENRFPEVQQQTQLISIGRNTVGNDPLNRDYETIWIADANFFQFFDFEFIHGDPVTALTQPDNLVITESIAQKYFGETEVVGRLLYTNSYEATISGVIKDFPSNSHIRLELIHSEPTWARIIEGWNNWVSSNWTSNSFITYVRMQPNFEKAAFEKKLTDLVTSNYNSDVDYTSSFALQPLRDIHLYSSEIQDGMNVNQGSPLYLYMFAIISVLILVIACFNYMNLSTAAASRRTREVGMRKTLGAGKGQLITQYLGESLILSMLSLSLAIVSVEVFLPYINVLTGKALSLPFNSLPLITALLLTVLIAGVLSALYPAFFLSRVNPASAFKNEIRIGTSSFSLRKILVVTQFSISIGMIAATLIIYQQLSYLQEKELGFDIENQLVIDINSGIMRSQYQSIKQEIKKLPEVEHVSVSSRVPGEWKTFPVARVGNPEVQTTSDMIYIGADDAFLNTYNIELITGRNLRDEPADSASVLITEQGVTALGLTDPVGKWVNINGTIWDGDLDEDDLYQFRIVGIIEDFHFESLHKSQRPVMIASNRNPIHNIDYYTVNVNTSNIPEAVNRLQEILHRFDPENPMELTFLDSRFEEIYRADQMRGKVFLFFSAIIIFIACMGLFALASFSIESRIKEIGIRKVLGASVQNIVLLVCKDFVTLVLVGFLLATPFAWYAAETWLSEFAYRISINPLFFIGAGVIGLGIAMITVSYHAIRSALINPVKSLKNE